MLYMTSFTMQAKAKLDEYLKNKPDADIQRRIKELDVKITTTSVSHKHSHTNPNPNPNPITRSQKTFVRYTLVMKFTCMLLDWLESMLRP
jgi:hypothetical protein